MAKPRPEPARLPPPSVAECWWTFAKWVLGVPLLVVGALALIWLAYWVTGSGGMVWQTESNIGTTLMYLGFIVLVYPVMLFIWWGDLRDGIRAARDWEAMTPEAQATAIAEAKAARAAAGSKRRTRRKE